MVSGVGNLSHLGGTGGLLRLFAGRMGSGDRDDPFEEHGSGVGAFFLTIRGARFRGVPLNVPGVCVDT